MFGCLEECLNYVNRLNLPNREEELQLDLLCPITVKNENKEMLQVKETENNGRL